MSATSLWTSVADHALRRPDARALVWRDGELSYGELLQLTSRARDGIDRLDPAGGRIIGMPAVKSPATIAAVLACLWTGRPAMLPSPTLPPSTRSLLFDRAGCRHVVHPDSLVTERGARRRSDSDGGSDADANDIAFILTTSGSTGLPKLVPLTIGAVERFVAWATEQFDIGPGTTVLNYAPLNFDLCFLDVWTTLHRGGTVVLVHPDAATSGDHLLGLVSDHRVDLVQAVPMCLRLMLDAAGGEPPQLDSVRHVISTGDQMPARTLAQLPSLFPRARLFNVYGCTETNDSFLYEIDLADMPGSAVPLGSPLPGVQAMIAGDDGNVVTGEGRGELLVATPFQTAGYVGSSGDRRDDPATRDRDATFVEHPSGDGVVRYFRTGDVVRCDGDGVIHLEGRNDFQVKVRGTRVNTAEVEQALLAHDEVLEAAVIAVPDGLAGHLLHSVVRRAPAARLNSLTLRQHCAERLPRAAIPSTLRLVDEPLPLTSTGKVDRKCLVRTVSTPESTAPIIATARKDITDVT